MKAALAIGLGALAAAVGPAAADVPPAAASVAPPVPGAAQDRLLLSVNGETLSGGSGGGGAEALWAHTFESADTLSGGAEYQQVSNAHWTDGVLGGSLALGQGASTDLYAEAHEGAGDLAMRGFHYNVETIGALETPLSWLSVQVEERRIDVDTSHGNLPKLGLSLRATPALLVSVSYADTAGGNLGTRLATLRVDYSSRVVTALAGIAGGHASPNVLNLLGQVIQSSPTLTELFAGVGRSIGRADWQLLADYQHLGGFKRTTLTLACTLHLGGQGRP
ncbi:MAG TPA: hypothetical protein VMB48_00265 [Steroidobacteraceae bacterium]|nr:hypothetical protein [Steroidobacteraceae bacterium]